jgi:prepilin-type N-terminal cleavage/methylation domain-containing protein
MYSKNKYNSKANTRAGFTLLEVLVVVGILILMASSAIILLDTEDDQRRFERTQADYAEIHDAIFGRRQGSGQDAGTVSGFLADTGMLPRSLNELIIRPDDIPAWSPIGGPNINIDYEGKGGRLYHGWRGPYLGRFRADLVDPWGNPWFYQLPNESEGTPLMLGSLGRNGMIGGEDIYDRNFPENLEIEKGYYSLGMVPLPSKTIGYDKEGHKEEFGPFVLGILHAGVDLNDRFNGHYSLIRDPQNNNEIFFFEPRGFKWKDKDKPDKIPRKEFKEEDSYRVPQNLFYNGAPNVRQFQYVAYDPSRPGPQLQHKLVSIDPHVMTYRPQVSATGYVFPESGKHQADWLIPEQP